MYNKKKLEKYNESLCWLAVPFETMLKKLNINYTEEQFDTYNKIRDARNDIIHGRKKVEIQKHDIINCYMFLSKVMFYKLKEN